MSQWKECCPMCVYYQGDMGICTELHFNVQGYQKGFAKKCDGRYYKNDPNKKINVVAAEAEPNDNWSGVVGFIVVLILFGFAVKIASLFWPF